MLLFVAMMTSLTLLVGAVDPTCAQTAVTSCGQVIEGDGYLTGDLNCGSGTEAAVQIHSGGSLDLRGFGIQGGEYGVLCAGEAQIIGGLEVFPYAPCRVFGGGTIDGQSVVGIVASFLDLADVTVRSDASIALIIHKRLSFTNMTLQLGPTAVGIETGPKQRIDGIGLTISGGGGWVGIQGGTIKIDGVTASGYRTFAGVGMLVRPGDTPLPFLRTVKLSRASLTGGSRAIDGARSVTLTDSVVTGHSDTAIKASRITLRRSSVTGNGLDLYADYRPRL